MESWEIAADFFGPQYTMFIVFVVNSFFFMGCMTAAWTSPVLAKLNGTEDNPLGRPISPEESDLIGSLFYVGAAIGPLLFISSVEKLGRKKALILLSFIVPIAYATLAFANKVEIYYICRVALGFYVGAAFSIQPVYVSEIIAADERGYLMSFVSFFSISGLLAAYILGSFLPLFYFNSFIAIFSLIIIVLLAFCCPESPYYVMQFEGKNRAREVLKKLRTKNDVEKELEEIEETVEEEARKSYLELFSTKENFKAFVMATTPLLLQQFSGITVIITYSQLIFIETDVSIPSHQCSIIVAGLQLITTFLTPTLLKCKKFSRKSLLIFTLLGVGFCNFSISFYFFFARNIGYLNWLPLGGLIGFVIFYNCGLDPIPWMLIGEIYPMNIKAVGSAFSASVFSLAVFPLLYSFHKVPMCYMFLGSACCCFLGTLYVKIFVTETEGKSLREIHENILRKTVA
ncbi:hypothetical protein HHI36_015888 [Cryptolaemus montrouzieri]|uniref:Major facilitator superfamily (MFS) profile domain-containing protein n=1 Tax=Cryptolaemus montrouzieri TaxID=559131 RepID=A0ABD2N832_9CUCU